MDRTPNWAKWDFIHDLAVWQVVSLSLDIEPETVKVGSSWDSRGTFPNEDKAFRDRLCIIEKNYVEIELPPKHLPLQNIKNCSLNLIKFADWAKKVDLPISRKLMQRATVDWSKYLLKDLWSESELQGFLCGLEPNASRETNKSIQDAIEDIKRGVLSKKLPVTESSNAVDSQILYDCQRFFSPDDAIRWAGNRFPKFPFQGKPVEVASAEMINEEKPLHPRTENNYLRLINELAISTITGFDAKHPYQAADLIIEKTSTVISRETLANYISKASTLIAKEKS